MNPVTIEQEQPDFKNAIVLHRNANLEGLRLVSANISCQVPRESIAGELKIEVAFQVVEPRAPAGKLVLPVDFAFRATRQEGEAAAKDVITVLCRFEADYALRPGFEPAPEQIGAFHRANAVFNVWPYFREFVQSAVVRMGLSAPPIPFLRLQPKPPEKEKAEAGPKRRRVKTA